jgi:hypothetical protein
MQKKHAKGFFINSSYRKTCTLKALLHGHGHHKEASKESGDPCQYSEDPDSPNDAGDVNGGKADGRVKTEVTT